MREIRHVQEALPPVRQWCGGSDWPAIVEHVTASLERSLRHAAFSIIDDVLQAESSCQTAVVHGDFGPHNILWETDNTPGSIDFDNACLGDPAIELAPLIGHFGAARVGEITDAETLERARIHGASLPLQVAAAAELTDDVELKDQTSSNFASRFHANSLYDPSGPTTDLR